MFGSRGGPKGRKLGFRRPGRTVEPVWNPTELVLTNDGDLVRRDLLEAVAQSVAECDRLIAADGYPAPPSKREDRWIQWIQRYHGPIDEECARLFGESEAARFDA